jgi:hypothetical protein
VWLDLKQPRDAALYATVSELIDLQTGRLPLDEMVLTMRYTSDFPPRWVWATCRNGTSIIHYASGKSEGYGFPGRLIIGHGDAILDQSRESRLSNQACELANGVFGRLPSGINL